MKTVQEVIINLNGSISEQDITQWILSDFGFFSLDQEITEEQAQELIQIYELADTESITALRAAKRLGIPLSEFEETFEGEYDSVDDFFESNNYFEFFEGVPDRVMDFVDLESVQNYLMNDFNVEKLNGSFFFFRG